MKHRHISLYYTLLLAFVASFRTTKDISNQRQCVAERLRNLELQILQELRFDFLMKVALKIIMSPCSLVESYRLLESNSLPHSLLFSSYLCFAFRWFSSYFRCSEFLVISPVCYPPSCVFFPSSPHDISHQACYCTLKGGAEIPPELHFVIGTSFYCVNEIILKYRSFLISTRTCVLSKYWHMNNTFLTHPIK